MRTITVDRDLNGDVYISDGQHEYTVLPDIASSITTDEYLKELINRDIFDAIRAVLRMGLGVEEDQDDLDRYYHRFEIKE